MTLPASASRRRACSLFASTTLKSVIPVGALVVASIGGLLLARRNYLLWLEHRNVHLLVISLSLLVTALSGIYVLLVMASRAL